MDYINSGAMEEHGLGFESLPNKNVEKKYIDVLIIVDH